MTSPGLPTAHLTFEDRHEGRVATLTVANAAKLNVLNSALIEQLRDRLRPLRDDDEIRALILTGSGDKAFIGGADIREMATLTPETARAFITRLHRLCEDLRNLPVPVIARISGYCLGAGLEVAVSCDIRIAAHGSVFGMPEVRVGIPSVIEAALLPRVIGWGKTRELVFTGRSLSADEALQWGLVEHVVAPEDLDGAIESSVADICAAGPRAIRHQKALIRQWEVLPIPEAIDAGIDTFSTAYRTPEPRRYMQRFLDRKRSGSDKTLASEEARPKARPRRE